MTSSMTAARVLVLTVGAALGLTTSAQAQNSADETPLEVFVVEGDERSPASSFSAADLRRLPGAFGDPFRAIEALPGVTPVASGLPYFLIRGAPPGHVGYFIDGIRVPQLYHLFFGYSVVHPSLIHSIELFRGGYPAAYGRYTGGIVTADLAEPSGRVHGEAGLRLIDSGALIEAPFAGTKGNARVSGRYAYTKHVLPLFSDVDLGYWDYQGVVSYDLGPEDTLGLFTFGSSDHFEQEGLSEFGSGSQFHRVDLRYDHRFGNDGHARVALTAGYDRTATDYGHLSDEIVGGRFHFVHALADGVELHAGADVQRDSYELEVDLLSPDYPDLTALFPTREDTTAGAYLELALRPEPWVQLALGVRSDLFQSQDQSAVGVDPRASAAFVVRRGVRVLHAFGIAHQSPDFVPGVPGARVAGLQGGLQRSIQASSGVEVDLPSGFVASLTAFENVFSNLVDPLGVSRDVYARIDSATIRSQGSSYGLEAMIKRQISEDFSGFVTYTLSRSERSHGRIGTLSAIDRTHVANAALVYEVLPRTRLGLRLFAMSGVPTEVTTPEGLVFDGETRTRPFYRVDVRIDRSWQLAERVRLSAVAELLNATFNEEVIRRRCDRVCRDTQVGPVAIPNVGAELAF